MNAILLIMKNILRQLFRKKSSLLIYLILPMVGLILPLAMFGSDNGNAIKVGIVDKDSGSVSVKLLEDLKLQNRFKVTIVDESIVNKEITDGTLDCALIIPEDYSASFLKGDIKRIEVASVQGIAATAWVESYLHTFLSNLDLLSQGAKHDIATFDNLYITYRQEATAIETLSVKDNVTNYNITYLGMGFLIQFLLIGAGRTASLIIREREEKTLARIRCAPVRSYEFITGNVIINVCLLAVQTVVTLVFLKYIFKVDAGVSLLSLIIIMLPLLIAAVGMALMIASFAKNERHLGTLMTIFIYPTCLLAGCFWDVNMMPEFMQKIAKFMPQRWALDGIESMIMGNKLSDLTLNFVVLFAFAAAFFAIAVFGFSKKQATAA